MRLRRSLSLLTLLLLVPYCCALSAPQAHAKRVHYRETVDASSIAEDRVVSDVLKEAELDAKEHEQFEARLLNATFGDVPLDDFKTSLGGGLDDNDDVEMDENASLPLHTHVHKEAFDVDAEDADVSFQDQATDGNTDSATVDVVGRRDIVDDDVNEVDENEQWGNVVVGSKLKETDATAQQQANVHKRLSLLRANSTLEGAAERTGKTQVWLQPSWVHALPKSVGASVQKVLARIAEKRGHYVKGTQSQKTLSSNSSNDLTQQCVPYVVLTMQRSGSTWLQRELPKALRGHVRSSWEAFNVRDHQAGADFLASAGELTPRTSSNNPQQRAQALKKLGAMRWAQYVWQNVEASKAPWLGPPLESPCAVGFKIMGPDVDAFSLHDTEALLADPRVKKIILDRRSTRDQWLSRQWACWSNDYSSHKAGSANPTKGLHPMLLAKQGVNFVRMKEDGSWKNWIEDRVREGKYCKCGQSTEFLDFKASKNRVYNAWRRVLRQTQQTWLELQTERLNEDGLFRNVSNFLFSTSAPINM